MSLLEEIKRYNSGAAKQLQQVECCSNSDIQSLTREDLNELFPGVKHFKLRRTIREIIHKQKPIHLVLNELKGFLPLESLKAALSGNGALSEYLLILKDMKTQIEKVSQFIEAHITLLEENTRYLHENETPNCSVVLSKTTPTPTPTTTEHPPLHPKHSGNQGQDIPSGLVYTTPPLSPSRLSRPVGSTGTSEKGKTALGTVKFLCITSSETFGAHQTLLDRVNSLGRLQLMPTSISQECQTVIVFCPVCSRLESDIDAALSKIPESMDNKPVILVLLHHKRDADFTAPRMPLASRRHNIVITVNALYHDSVRGLLSCSTNDEAVSEMHTALLEHSGCSGAASGHAVGAGDGRYYGSFTSYVGSIVGYGRGTAGGNAGSNTDLGLSTGSGSFEDNGRISNDSSCKSSSSNVEKGDGKSKGILSWLK